MSHCARGYSLWRAYRWISLPVPGGHQPLEKRAGAAYLLLPQHVCLPKMPLRHNPLSLLASPLARSHLPSRYVLALPSPPPAHRSKPCWWEDSNAGSS